MYFDRYDICEAYDLLATNYSLHDVHIRLRRLDFKCSPLVDSYNCLTDNGRAIYDHNAALLDAGTSPIKSEFKR